ncbi:hypothetical protein Arnit_2593 [Arcobacter nitrofigilis DSM 7299]|uniref:DUF2846 domain-containing protein n=1 Tax=Arcobacter nitrofigilis (strain ATCC 33309 / DSM 7299 / CCUG 15893 / LMG 7604 / NCTC 12251 / CI) TaxID=572480 RepID=D5V6H1_ARCNC|nr:hypothetical protein [Arcobacter nitrofigilis]ADG94241.1 hypothetical protein Arnit_2593 [Arcobacter nitrofigilis DSM 7299]
MKIVKILFFTFVTTFILSGCVSDYMVKVPGNKINKPVSDKATIVFMRSSFVSSALSVTLFEVNDGNLSFIGFLPNGSKIAYKTSPGEKVYMAVGYAADFMLANVKAGQTYYVIVRPNWGTGGFAPTPIRTNGTTDYNTDIPAFKKWVNGTTLYATKPIEAAEWFEKNKDTYLGIYANYWARFQTKTPNEKAQRTLTFLDAYELNQE